MVLVCEALSRDYIGVPGSSMGCYRVTRENTEDRFQGGTRSDLILIRGTLVPFNAHIGIGIF